MIRKYCVLWQPASHQWLTSYPAHSINHGCESCTYIYEERVIARRFTMRAATRKQEWLEDWSLLSGRFRVVTNRSNKQKEHH